MTNHTPTEGLHNLHGFPANVLWACHPLLLSEQVDPKKLQAYYSYYAGKRGDGEDPYIRGCYHFESGHHNPADYRRAQAEFAQAGKRPLPRWQEAHTTIARSHLPLLVELAETGTIRPRTLEKAVGRLGVLANRLRGTDAGPRAEAIASSLALRAALRRGDIGLILHPSMPRECENHTSYNNYSFNHDTHRRTELPDGTRKVMVEIKAMHQGRHKKLDYHPDIAVIGITNLVRHTLIEHMPELQKTPDESYHEYSLRVLGWIATLMREEKDSGIGHDSRINLVSDRFIQTIDDHEKALRQKYAAPEQMPASQTPTSPEQMSTATPPSGTISGGGGDSLAAQVAASVGASMQELPFAEIAAAKEKLRAATALLGQAAIGSGSYAAPNGLADYLDQASRCLQVAAEQTTAYTTAIGFPQPTTG